LSFNALQLNRDYAYGAVTDNQLRSLVRAGLIATNLNLSTAARLVDPYNSTADLNERARSWLHVNCSNCHRQHAGGSVLIFMNYDAKPAQTRLTEPPTQGSLGINGAHVVSPGDPLHSALFCRISTTGPGHMPHIGSRLVDVAGSALIYDWIKQLPPPYLVALTNDVPKPPSEPDFANLETRAKSCVQQSSNQRGETIDQLLATVSGVLILVHEIDAKTFDGSTRGEIIDRAAAHPNPMVRDLFDRFLPDDKRVKRLGPNIKPDQILALTGRAANGKKVFFQEGGVQCTQCHIIQGQGRNFGPDLSQIGRKYSRSQLLDNILFPSKVIDPAFVAYSVETTSGLSYSALIIRKSATELVMKDANLAEIKLPMSEVKSMQAQALSSMPEGLLQNLTAQEAADLIEFLVNLK